MEPERRTQYDQQNICIVNPLPLKEENLPAWCRQCIGEDMVMDGTIPQSFHSYNFQYGNERNPVEGSVPSVPFQDAASQVPHRENHRPPPTNYKVSKTGAEPMFPQHFEAHYFQSGQQSYPHPPTQQPTSTSYYERDIIHNGYGHNLHPHEQNKRRNELDLGTQAPSSASPGQQLNHAVVKDTSETASSMPLAFPVYFEEYYNRQSKRPKSISVKAISVIKDPSELCKNVPETSKTPPTLSRTTTLKKKGTNAKKAPRKREVAVRQSERAAVKKHARIVSKPMTTMPPRDRKVDVSDSVCSVALVSDELSNSWLGSLAVTSKGVAVLPVPLHFRSEYCDRMACFVTQLQGQPPHCEITTKFDRAANVAGVRQLERGGWSQYGESSGDLMRDAAANFLTATHPAPATNGTVTRKRGRQKEKTAVVVGSSDSVNTWSVYVESENGFKVKVGEGKSKEATAQLFRKAQVSIPSLDVGAFKKSLSKMDAERDCQSIGPKCSAFIDPLSGVLVEKQMASYCSLHAFNAMLGSIQLGCSPEILHTVEKALHKLECTQPTQLDAYMDHQAIVSLGRNLGVYLISMALDSAAITAFSSSSKGLTAFVQHLVRIQRFILGRPQSRGTEGHFVCVQVRLLSKDKKKKRLSSREDSGLEWLLIDSMETGAVSFPSFAALLKAFVGGKRADVPPFLIVPLLYSASTLSFLQSHMSNLGSIFDLPQAEMEFTSEDDVSLLMMLVERKTAPAHGLSLSMILSLLSGDRRLESFGLDFQIEIDFRDRIAAGNSSAVQRSVEGDPHLLQSLSESDQSSVLVLTSLSRVINDSSFVAHVMQRVLKARTGAKTSHSVKAQLQLKQQAVSTMVILLRQQQPGYEGVLTESQRRTVSEDIERVVSEYLDLEARNSRRVANKRTRS